MVGAEKRKSDGLVVSPLSSGVAGELGGCRIQRRVDKN